MTLPRLEAIVKHWDEVPPLSVSAAQLATYFGVSKARSQPAKKRGKKQDAGELISMFGGRMPGLKIVGGKDG